MKLTPMDILANAAEKVKYGTIGWEILNSVAMYLVFKGKHGLLGYTSMYMDGKRIRTRKRFTDFKPAMEINRNKSMLAKKHKKEYA